MLELLTTALALDPITVDLIWTVAMSALLLLGGALSLAMLPWTDREIEDVDRAFYTFWAPVGRRVPASRV